MTVPLLQPQMLPWADAATAGTWPEGSIVLVHRTDRPSEHCGAYRVSTHFRPDWAGADHGYGLACRYLLLECAQPTASSEARAAAQQGTP